MLRRPRLSLYTAPCKTCGSDRACTHCRCPGYKECGCDGNCVARIRRARVCRSCSRARASEARKTVGSSEPDAVVLRMDARMLDAMGRKLRGLTRSYGGPPPRTEFVTAVEKCFFDDCRYEFTPWIDKEMDRCSEEEMREYVTSVCAKGEAFALCLLELLLEPMARHSSAASTAGMQVVRELEKMGCPIRFG